MTIDPKTLAQGTIVTIADGAWYGDVRECEDGDDITGVFVPVPDGMDVDTASRILTDHDQWQPITGAPTEHHLGKRVRVDLDSYGSPDAGQWYVHKEDAADDDAELIEAMAKAFHEEEFVAKWEDLDEDARRVLRGQARAALAVVLEHEARP